MSNLICSAATKEDLQQMINRYYYSNSYIITDDLRVYNTVTHKILDNTLVINKRGRWRYEWK